jgi:lipopolysaccharide/colanic/teichoic acid biosynthesis glycosyltransferase
VIVMDLSETRLETRTEPAVGLQPRELVTQQDLGYVLLKRSLDIALSSLAIILLLPVFIAVALAIKLEDPRGNVLFRQARVGKNGQVFFMYKFRSMVSEAETLLGGLLEKNEISGAMFKMKSDPRVTRVGRWIRKLSIDEFPQFYNVLRGEMSLVGPRPPLPREVENYSPYEMNRLSVTPGCTGLWQISGRNALNFKQMVELDIQYIETCSMRLDLKIIWRTFWMLLLAKNGL